MKKDCKDCSKKGRLLRVSSKLNEHSSNLSDGVVARVALKSLKGLKAGDHKILLSCFE